MVVEGKGLVAPRPLCVAISDHEMRVICEASSDLNHYQGSSDPWKRGLLGGADLSALRLRVNLADAGQTLPIIAGKLGEYAVWTEAVKKFGKIFPPVDFRRRASGDDGIDLVLADVKLQVKTRVTSKRNLVRAIDSYGRIIPVVGHAHIFCSWQKTDSFVYVLGWIRNRELARMPTECSAFGAWKNFVISDNQLLPMRRLFDELRMRLQSNGRLRG